MRIEIKVGDVLDEPADVLIASANPQLNLSGGVGGAILLRGGQSVQAELHGLLRSTGQRLAEPGTVHRTAAGPLAVRCILHAVAVDAFYESSVDLIERTLRCALALAASLDARKVACPALAAGYGRMGFEEFGQALRNAGLWEYPPLETLVVVVRREENAAVLRRLLVERLA